MDPMLLALTGGALTILVIEGIKWVVRKIKKDPQYSLPANFYIIATPLLNAVAPFGLVALGVQTTDPVLSMTVVSLVQYLARTLLSTLTTLIGYNQGLKPLNDYRTAEKAQKEAEIAPSVTLDKTA